MDHYLGVRQDDALARCASSKQNRPHRRCKPHADGGNIALDVLHGVIDGEAGRNRASRRINVERDILIGINRFQVQKLCNYRIRNGVVNGLTQENDALIEQTGIDIIAALTAGRLLHNVWHKS